MDRPLTRSDRLNGKVKGIAIVLAVVLGIFGLGRLAIWLSLPTLDANQVIIATVDRGPVTAAIETTGVLVPEQEVVLTSPLESRVMRVLHQPGTVIRAGDAILELDVSSLALEKETLSQQLAAKENEKRQAALRHAREMNERKAELELNDLDLRFLEASFRQQTTLFEEGLTSKEELQQADLQLKRSRVLKRQLEDANRDAIAGQAAEQDGLDLDIELLRKSLAELDSRLARATTRTTTGGVLTWVVQAEGSTVRSGDVLARIADLSRYKVSATLSDFYAGRIYEGQEVSATVDNEALTGKVSRVLPEVVNGTLTFEVRLERQNAGAWRPNQRVDVLLQTGHRADTLRVRRGPALPGTGRHRIYKINDGQAVATVVEAGMNGARYTEILGGLQVGDRVVMSDLRDHRHLETIPIKGE